MDYRATAGRPLGGVEARVADDEGKVLPRDGHSTGEIEVRGPWVAAAYYKDPAPEKFRDGWLRTGDVGRIDAKGYITISDRAKDVVSRAVNGSPRSSWKRRSSPTRRSARPRSSPRPMNGGVSGR